MGRKVLRPPYAVPYIYDGRVDGKMIENDWRWLINSQCQSFLESLDLYTAWPKKEAATKKKKSCISFDCVKLWLRPAVAVPLFFFSSAMSQHWFPSSAALIIQLFTLLHFILQYPRPKGERVSRPCWGVGDVLKNGGSSPAESALVDAQQSGQRSPGLHRSLQVVAVHECRAAVAHGNAAAQDGLNMQLLVTCETSSGKTAAVTYLYNQLHWTVANYTSSLPTV